ncbi:hypothetical protein [Actinoplanes sp. NPDC051494]|uniref:hypothetical protein n=1 Tax=Actinoplanes sp. NPDC051494 TaxID=3363907 RepID=UPI0037AB7738
MNDHGDQLREAFHTHENQTPDPAEVYARVQDLSRTYKNRRRGAQLAGGAVLGAGLLVGAFQVPALLSANQNTAITSVAPAGPAAASPSPSVSVSVSASPVAADQDDQLDAYFAGGYDYDDAVKLARMWNMSKKNIDAVKARAGQVLLDGKDLPFAGDPVDQQSAEEAAQVAAFFDAGYDIPDAVELSKLWRTKDAYGAKVMGGKKLLAGETLPIQP